VLDLELPGFTVKKGFLAKAKCAEPREVFRAREWDRLAAQYKTKMEIAPDSFVIIYSRREGMRVVPAISVLGDRGRDLFDHYHRSVQSFFRVFIECFVGDGRLNSTEISVLDALRGATVERVLELQVQKATQ
jgi:hypothetical protein